MTYRAYCGICEQDITGIRRTFKHYLMEHTFEGHLFEWIRSGLSKIRGAGESHG